MAVAVAQETKDAKSGGGNPFDAPSSSTRGNRSSKPKIAKKDFMAEFFADVEVIKQDILKLADTTREIQDLTESCKHNFDTDAIPNAMKMFEVLKKDSTAGAKRAKNMLNKVKQENLRRKDDTRAK